MTQCRDCGKEYNGAASSEPGLCQTCMPRWLMSAQSTAEDYARQWQTERIRAENLAAINRDLLEAVDYILDDIEAWSLVRKYLDPKRVALLYAAQARARGQA